MVEEEDVAESVYHHANDLEAHGRIDVMTDLSRHDAERLHRLIGNHARYTGSRRAAEILGQWEKYCPLFRKVMPVEFRRALAELKAQEAEKPLLAAGA